MSMNQNENIEEYWRKRRTVRCFSDKEVEDQLLEDLIDKASHAPTTGNMQLYSVIITRDSQMKARLSPAHFNQPAMTGAPVLLTFCADFNRFVKWCRASEAEPGYDNFQSFVSAMLDVTIFTQQFVTVAELAGLGCCYLGTTTYNAPQIAEVLELPPMVVPVTALSVGYPAADGHPSDRLPVKALVHHERYSDPTMQQVKEFYAEKEALEESAVFIKENGKKTLAQVFTDVRYTRENNEIFSKIYRDFIEKAGFAFPDK